MGKKRVRRYNFSQPPTSPPEVVRFRGQHDEEKREYWTTHKAIRYLGLAGGEELCVAIVNVKAALHFIPGEGKDKYGQYVLRSDVELMKTLLESGITFQRSEPLKEVPFTAHVPIGWSGYDEDWSEKKVEYVE